MLVLISTRASKAAQGKTACSKHIHTLGSEYVFCDANTTQQYVCVHLQRYLRKSCDLLADGLP